MLNEVVSRIDFLEESEIQKSLRSTNKDSHRSEYDHGAEITSETTPLAKIQIVSVSEIPYYVEKQREQDLPK